MRRVKGYSFRVWDLGRKISRSGFKVSVSWLRAEVLGFSHLELKFQGFQLRLAGSEFSSKVQGPSAGYYLDIITLVQH